MCMCMICIHVHIHVHYSTLLDVLDVHVTRARVYVHTVHMHMYCIFLRMPCVLHVYVHVVFTTLHVGARVCACVYTCMLVHVLS